MSQPFGRYNLLDFVASGGMADVFRAEAPGAAGFVKEVAIKVIRGDFGDRPELIEMFKQEARLASRLNHANIVQVFDFDEVEGRYYITMEFVRGRTLGQLVNRCRTAMVDLGLAKAVYICAQVAAALAFAHRQKENGQPLGIVHRDVSPQNVLISFEGEVKLTDFGIARAMNAGGLTRPGMVKGKPAYMAPEQARGNEVDGRADVFALGVVLWEICCGFNLFERDSESASLLAVIGPDPEIVPPSKLNPLVPPELDSAVLGALERDLKRRTASAEDLAAQLQAVLYKLAQESAAFDLRSLMSKLWPEGATAAGIQHVATVRLPTPGALLSAPSPRAFTPLASPRARTPEPLPRARTPQPAFEPLEDNRPASLDDEMPPPAARFSAPSVDPFQLPRPPPKSAPSETSEMTSDGLSDPLQLGLSCEVSALDPRPDPLVPSRPSSRPSATPRSSPRQFSPTPAPARSTPLRLTPPRSTPLRSTPPMPRQAARAVSPRAPREESPRFPGPPAADPRNRHWSTTRIVAVSAGAAVLLVVALGAALYFTPPPAPRIQPPSALPDARAETAREPSRAPGAQVPPPLSPPSQPRPNDPLGPDLGGNTAAADQVAAVPHAEPPAAPVPEAIRGDKQSDSSAPPKPARRPVQHSADATSPRQNSPSRPDGSPQGEATIEVVSTTWAIIYLDGKRVGFTPMTLTVPAGAHRLRAEHEGMAPVEHTIKLGPGQHDRWSPQLRPPSR